jgi:UDP:flavonoid glycosyltransferase YjiC (YdhE family)
VSSGAGLSFHPDDAGAGAVRDAVEKVLRDPAYGAAAVQVRDEIAGMPDPAEVARRLQELVN